MLESRDPDALLPELLPFIMQTEPFHAHSKRESKGSVNPYVNFSDLASYEFLLPPLDEQRRTAAVLTAITTVSQLHEQAAASAKTVTETLLLRHLKGENLGSVVYDERFGEYSEKLPLTHIGHLLTDTQYGLSEPAVSGGEFRMLRMMDLALIAKSSKHENAKQPALGAGEKLVLGHPLAATIGNSARCMQNLEKVLFTGPKTSGHGDVYLRLGLADGVAVDSDSCLVDLSKEEFNRYRLDHGDVLFNRTNSYELVGRTGVYKLDGNHVFASYLIRLKTNAARILPDYLCAFLNAPVGRRQVMRFATRAVSQTNVNASNLRTMLIPLPPLDYQRRVIEYVESPQKSMASASTESQRGRWIGE